MVENDMILTLEKIQALLQFSFLNLLFINYYKIECNVQKNVLCEKCNCDCYIYIDE